MTRSLVRNSVMMVLALAMLFPALSFGQTTIARCPNMPRSLSPGSAGGDVSDMQTFLQAYGTYSGDITGYYGDATVAAVQQFQTQAGILSGGSPSTTGWGAVGPLTRTAIATRCNAISSFSVPGTANLVIGQTSVSADKALSLTLNSIDVAQTATIGSSPQPTAAHIGVSVNPCGANTGCGAALQISNNTLSASAPVTVGPYTLSLSFLANTNAAIRVTTAGSAVATTTTTTTTSTGACVTLTHNMGTDDTDADTGGDVTRLQTFLAQDPSIYPEGRITGYFGPATQRAVQNWQARAGIVSSGDPDSTGYGFVGRKTRAAMSASCGGTTVTADFSATPTSGTAPLSVTFNVRNHAGATIDFGDGTAMTVPTVIWECALGVSVCTPPPTTVPHIYSANGTYTAKLENISASQTFGGTACTGDCAAIAGVASQADTSVISALVITVSPGSLSGAPVISSLDVPSSLAAGQSGTWTVHATTPTNGGTLSYSVVWGDEVSAASSAQASASAPVVVTGTFTHTYANAGTYTPTFTVSNSAGSNHAGASITVTGAVAIAGKQIFTSSGNFTVPAGVTSVNVVAIGGGGGGGGGANGWGSGAGGGCGGGIAGGTLAVTPGASIAVTVGTGGAGGPDATDGSSGSPSTFSSVSADGGGWGRSGHYNLYDQHAGGTGGGSGGGGGGNAWPGYQAVPGAGGTAGTQTNSKGAGGYCTGAGWNVNLVPLITLVPYSAGNGGSAQSGNVYQGGGGGGGLVLNGSTVNGANSTGGGNGGNGGAGYGGGGGGTSDGGTGGAGAPGVVYIEWNGAAASVQPVAQTTVNVPATVLPATVQTNTPGYVQPTQTCSGGFSWCALGDSYACLPSYMCQ